MWIGSRYRSDDWAHISQNLPTDGGFAGDDPRTEWAEPVEVMRDRVDTRFMRTADLLRRASTAGFVLLLVDSLLIEFLQRLRTDQLDAVGSRELVTTFLRDRARFDAFRDTSHRGGAKCPCIACDFYRNARSGIAHYAETRSDWLVKFGRPELLGRENGARVIDRNRFHVLVEDEYADYYRELLEPANQQLRKTLKDALDGVCGLRTRGLASQPSPLTD